MVVTPIKTTVPQKEAPANSPADSPGAATVALLSPALFSPVRTSAPDEEAKLQEITTLLKRRAADVDRKCVHAPCWALASRVWRACRWCVCLCPHVGPTACAPTSPGEAGEVYRAKAAADFEKLSAVVNAAVAADAADAVRRLLRLCLRLDQE